MRGLFDLFRLDDRRVRGNAIAPGYFRTDLTEPLQEYPDRAEEILGPTPAVTADLKCYSRSSSSPYISVSSSCSRTSARMEAWGTMR